MVRSNHPHRNRRTDEERSYSTDRGQVILIGAIALAFIILGVVVVFNGVLYTETLSSSDTGQSAATAEKTELEIAQGVSCLIVGVNDEVDLDDPDIKNTDELNATLESGLQDEIREFNKVYRNATAESSPAAANISDVDPIIVDEALDRVDVTITYDSNDISYEQERTIYATDCPGES